MNDPADPFINRIVAGKYCVGQALGKGGMGRVHRAVHLGLHETVAIKFLHPSLAMLDEVRQRFRREATALARLRHPSTVAVLDYGEEDDEPYIVMELVNGQTLSQLVLTQHVELALDRVGRIFDQVLSVLELAHGAGIVHRDLKLENVMLVAGPEGIETAKVLDFGLAHMDTPGQTRLTESGSIRGTPHYMSPEQCRGRDVGPATDIYATGVMLYEVLTNESPFDAKDAAQLMAQHMFVDPAPPSMRSFTREISAGIDRLVLMAMAKTLAERPTASQMRTLLAECILGHDEKSIAARDEVERARVGALTRAERSIGGLGEKTEVGAMEGRVALWGVRPDLASELATALGMGGVVARIAQGDDVPADVLHITTRLLVVPDDGTTAVERMRRVREAVAPRSLPVLVLDVRDADRTAKLVREGVSDAAHTSVGVPDLVKKIRRLLKRGR